jgi:hypothetical protein
MQSPPTVIVSEDASHGIVGRKGLLEFPIEGHCLVLKDRILMIS